MIDFIHQLLPDNMPTIPRCACLLVNTLLADSGVMSHVTPCYRGLHWGYLSSWGVYWVFQTPHRQ